MAGKDVIRVVRRIRNAQEDSNLDLSACRLMHLPDAIYLLLKNTELETCDLNHNRLRRLPPRFPRRFATITELHLRGNQLTDLPSEVTALAEVRSLDLSDNEFASLPDAVYSLNNLASLNASKNNITDVDVSRLLAMRGLAEVNLTDNPLTERARRQLKDVQDQLAVTYTEPDSPSSYEDLD